MRDPHDTPGARGDEVRPRRRRRDGWRSGEVVRTAVLVIAVYLVGRVFWLARPLFFTAFLGILFGLAVSSGADRLVRLKVPRGLAAGLIVISFIGLLVGFGAWMAPTIRAQGAELRQKLPDALDRAREWGRAHQNGMVGMMVDGVLNSDSTAVAPAPVAPVGRTAPAATDTTRTRTTATTTAAPGGDSVTIATTIRDRFGRRMASAKRFVFPFLTSTIEVVGGILIIIFLSIYIAADPGLYHGGIMSLFPRRKRRRAGEVLSAIAAVLRRWLLTQLIAMVVMGVITTIALLVLGVKAAFALGLLSGLLEFIPTFGPIISALPAVAMGFLDSPEKALIVTGTFVGLHFLENHLLIPLLMKGGVNAPPVLTILSQALMAILFGFIGLMVAVPMLAATLVAVKMLYVEDVVGQRALGPDENPTRGID